MTTHLKLFTTLKTENYSLSVYKRTMINDLKPVLYILFQNE